MPNKFNDLNGLIYYSTKLYNYLKIKFQKIEDKIVLLSENTSNITNDLIQKVKTNTDNITEISQNVNGNTNNITEMDSKIANLKTQVDNIDLNSTNGDVLYENNVKQYVFRNISAGETVSIPNESNSNNFIIDCFTEIDAGTVMDYTVINLDEDNTDKFIYDPNYIDVASDGIKPKDSILLGFSKQTVMENGLSYDIFTSDYIPSDVVDSIDSIIDIIEENV
jgi:hypothetical protein